MADLLHSNYTVSHEVNQSSSVEDKNHTAKIGASNERRVGLTYPGQIKNYYIFPSGVKNIRNENNSSQRDRNLRNEEDPHGLEGFPQYCMTCEKELPTTRSCRYLYCSETCKQEDQGFEDSLPTITANNSLRYSFIAAHNSHYYNDLQNLLRFSTTVPILSDSY